MPSPRDVLELVERMRCVSNDAERRALLASLGAVERPTILSFLNAHGVNVCMASDPALAAFRASDILLRDGVGLQSVLPFLGLQPGLNMNGTDFIPLLLRTLPARKVAVYGTATPWLERARAVLETNTPHQYADLQHGFHPVEHYIAQARASRPDVILLAMGMPRQEEVAALLKRSLDYPVLIVNGGAIVDFLAGRFKRAPEAVQRSGLEWAFRLAQEPKRLFNRYCVGAFGFARTVLLLRRAASLRSTPLRPAPIQSTGSASAAPRTPMHKEL
ncbi:WecB/TagA/CpsF family glycosyltransferase [Azospirillum agricola]|uniref:WecB/TagA/CpsF family glycosyltransferase n=1 Tax=Azospirillum agricola TaxID=1720247 RepID=UPI000A0F2C0D|nr:WecB/TagA/CpsF family glycosyltransferase [Azospirillum agricola]SMH44583.1 polymer biosynthesis protein, WecB/TagA/CpsF family [Azospirillum lipoferum]